MMAGKMAITTAHALKDRRTRRLQLAAATAFEYPPILPKPLKRTPNYRRKPDNYLGKQVRVLSLKNREAYKLFAFN